MAKKAAREFRGGQRGGKLDEIRKADAIAEYGEMPLGVSEDEQIVAQLGGVVLGFFRGLGAFLKKARDLEREAKAELDAARMLKVPATAAEDVAIQRVVLAATDHKKTVEEHWNPITQAFYRLHKILTGARGRAVDADDERKTITNGLHNTYTNEQRRKAEEEENRRRREEEQRAQAARDEELRLAEEQALKREADSNDLSERERVFVELVFMGETERTSAQRAGFKDPAAMAGRLMQAPKIVKALAGKREAEEIRRQAAATAAKPLDVQQHEEVRPDIERASGAHDRSTHSAEIINEEQLIAAIIQGGRGIPWDILTVKPAKLNEYAKQLHEKINAWPGVRYKKTTGVTR